MPDPRKPLDLSGANEILNAKRPPLDLSGAQDILKKKDSTLQNQDMASGTSTGSSDGINPAFKSNIPDNIANISTQGIPSSTGVKTPKMKTFDGFSNGDLSQMQNHKLPKIDDAVLAKVNPSKAKENQLRNNIDFTKVTPDTQDYVNDQTNQLSDQIKQTKIDNDNKARVIRDNLIKDKLPQANFAATPDNEDKATANNDYNTALNKTGIWNNIKQFGTDALNSVGSVMDKTGLIDESPNLKVENPLKEYTDKVVANAIKNNVVLNPSQVQQQVKDDYISNRLTEITNSKLNAFNSTLTKPEQEALSSYDAEATAHLDKENSDLVKSFPIYKGLIQSTHDAMDIANSEIQNYQNSGKEVPQELLDRKNVIQQKYNQFNNQLNSSYQKFTSNKKNIGTVKQEIDIFKTESNQFVDYIDRVGNASLGMASEGSDFLSYVGNAVGADKFSKGAHDVATSIKTQVNQNNSFLRNTSTIESPTDFIHKVLDFSANSIPMVAETATGVVGVALMAAQTAGSKHGDMVNEEADPKIKKQYSQLQKILVPLAYGATTVAPMLTQLKTIQNGARVWEAISKESTPLIEAGLKEKAGQILNAGIKYGKDSFKLGNELKGMALLQQGVDHFMLGKKFDYQKLSDMGVYSEATLLHAMNVGASLLTAEATKPFMSSTDTKQLDNNSKALYELHIKIQDPSLDANEKQIVQSSIDNISKNSNKLINDKINKIGDTPKQVVDAIIDATQKSSDYRGDAIRIQASDKFTDAQKSVMLSDLKIKYRENESHRVDLISGTKTAFDLLSGNEQAQRLTVASRKITDGEKANFEVKPEEAKALAKKTYLKELSDKKIEDAKQAEQKLADEQVPTPEVPQKAEAEKVENSNNPIANKTKVGLGQEGDNFFITTLGEGGENNFKQKVELTKEERRELREIDADMELDGNSTALVKRRQDLVNKIIKRNNLSDTVTAGNESQEVSPVEDVVAPSVEKPLSLQENKDVEDNRPIVYHGTKNNFDEFDHSFLGDNTKSNSAKEGFFFSTDKDVAISYASKSNQIHDELRIDAEKAEKELMDITGDTPGGYSYSKNRGYRMDYGDNPKEITENNEKIKSIFERINKFSEYDNVFNDEPIWNKNELADGASLKEVKLTMKNPFTYDFKGENYRDKSYTEIIKKAKEDGYDSVIFKNTFDGNNPYSNKKPSDIHVVFDKSQINEKSPQGNSTIDASIRPTATNVGESGNSEQESPISKDISKSINGGEIKGDVEVSKKYKLTKKGQAFQVKKNNGKFEVTNAKGEKVSKPTERAVLRKHAESFDFTQGDKAIDKSDFEDHPDAYNSEIAKKSNNPSEIAETIIYDQSIDKKGNIKEPTLDHKETIIADGLGKIKKEGFLNNDDTNNLTPQIEKSYFDKEGRKIDDLADELSERAGVKITRKDISDFIKKHPKGTKEFYDNAKNESKNSDILESNDIFDLKKKFEDVSGFPASNEFLNKAIEQQNRKSELNSSLDHLTDAELLQKHLEIEQFNTEQNGGKEINQDAKGDIKSENNSGSKQEPKIQGINSEKQSGQEVKDLGSKARDLAKEYRSGKNVLPDWLVADGAKGAKSNGINLNEAFANALETFADVHDATKDLVKAVNEGFEHIKDWYNTNGVEFDESGLKDKFQNHVESTIDNKEQSSPEKESLKVGVNNESMKKVADALGLDAPIPGEGWNSEDAVKTGRALLDAGAKLDPIIEKTKNSEMLTPEEFSVARAHFEDLSKNVDLADKSFGRDSKEYQEAKSKANKFYAEIIAPAKTKWSKLGHGMQGETDVYDGSFYKLEREFKKQLNVENLTKKQTELVEKLANDILKSKAKLEDNYNKITAAKEELAKIHEEGRNIKELKNSKTKAKELAIEIRKFKIHRPDIFSAANPATIVWDGAVETIAKIVENGGSLADAIDKGLEHIKNSKWYKNLDNAKKQEAIDVFNNSYDNIEKNKISSNNNIDTEEEAYQKEVEIKIKSLQKQLDDVNSGKVKDTEGKSSVWNKEISDLKAEIKDSKYKQALIKLKVDLADKVDNKFNPSQARDIWKYAKETYLDKGEEYPEMIRKVAEDLGLDAKQVINAIAMPKSSKITTREMYEQQKKNSQAVSVAKETLKDIKKGKIQTTIEKIPNAMRELKVYGHGGVGFMTHLMGAIKRPSEYKFTKQMFFDQYRLMYNKGKYKNYYEDSKTELLAHPNYHFWKMNGLDIDPTFRDTGYEVGKGSNMGERAFFALKLVRLAQAENAYNKLPEIVKSDPITARNIAAEYNYSSGSSKYKTAEGRITKRGDLGSMEGIANTMLFAKSLTVAKYQHAILNPIRAMGILSNSRSTIGEKAVAKITLKRQAESFLVHAGALAANAAILSLMGSKNTPNVTDPTKPDFLCMQLLDGSYIPLTKGNDSTYKLLLTLAKLGKDYHSGDKDKRTVASSLETQGRYMLSPFSGTTFDLALAKDAMGNPLEFLGGKSKFKRGMGILEYMLRDQTPIPVGEAISHIYKEHYDEHRDDFGIISWEAFGHGFLAGVVGTNKYKKVEDKKKSGGMSLSLGLSIK